MSNISYEAAAFLQQAFSPEQVEAIVNFQKSVNAQLATSAELQQVKTELKTEISQFEVRLNQRFDTLNQRMITTSFAAIGVFATLITVLKLFS